MMMKLWSSSSSSRVYRGVMHYSTQTLASKPTTSPTLYARLVEIRNPNIPIVPLLDQWVEEGNLVEQQELHQIIRQFRKFKRFTHALEICQWMSDKPYLEVTVTDVSVQLDLIGKIHGPEQAEEYFNSIPNTLKVSPVYGALLNCYVHAKSLKKAEATMQKMRELGYSQSLSYNVMLSMYSGLKEYEKFDLLLEEMEQKGISSDKFTYCIRLNAYASASKIQQMEKLLMKMEADPHVTLEWNAYTTVANGYLKAGISKKALASLKKAEYLIRPSMRKSAYEVLLTLYASLGRKDDVYRIWKLHKNIGHFFNSSYLCMMSSLAKMDAMDDVQKIYEEWESGYTSFDIRIPNFIISAYCKKGLLEKAESILKRLAESGKEPTGSTWSRVAMGYVKNDMMDKGVEAMRKFIFASNPGNIVDTATLSACLEYLDGKGDLDGAEEMIKLLHDKGLLSEVCYESLVKKLSRNTRI